MNELLDRFVDTKICHAAVIVVATVGAIATAIYMLVSGWMDGSLKEFVEKNK